MRNLTTIHNDQQQRVRNMADLTPFELAEIDRFQNANRGFSDESEEELENYYNQED